MILDCGRHSQWGLYCPQVSKIGSWRAKYLKFYKALYPRKVQPIYKVLFLSFISLLGFLGIIRAADLSLWNLHIVYKIRAIKIRQICSCNWRTLIHCWILKVVTWWGHLCLLVSGYWSDLWMVYILFLSAFVCDLNFENQGNLCKYKLL